MFENKEFDVVSASSKVREEYPESKVKEMIDEEIIGGCWVDSDWEEEYESEFDWYCEFGHGEAEDVVLSDIISWYQIKYGKLETDDEVELDNSIRDEYDINH